jgi:hypothetical protein
MKTLKLIVIGIVLFLATAAQAQVSVNLHVGTPPSWGPRGYSGVRYYYLPDVEAYYDIQASRFIYNERGVWVHRATLPRQYRNYDLNRGYKVVIRDYRGDAPYIHHNEFRQKYVRGYHGTEREYYFNKPGRGNEMKRMDHNGRSDQKFDRRDDRHDNGHSYDKKDDRRDNGHSYDKKDNRGHDHGNDRENK